MAGNGERLGARGNGRLANASARNAATKRSIDFLYVPRIALRLGRRSRGVGPTERIRAYQQLCRTTSLNLLNNRIEPIELPIEPSFEQAPEQPMNHTKARGDLRRVAVRRRGTLRSSKSPVGSFGDHRRVRGSDVPTLDARGETHCGNK